MISTFTPASPRIFGLPHVRCEGKGCQRDSSCVAWLTYEHAPDAQCYRLSGYHLCERCADAWAREGVPAWAMEWRRDFSGKALELLGSTPVPKAAKSKKAAPLPMPEPSRQMELVG